MKKQYIIPELETVTISTSHFLAASNPKVTGSEYQEDDPKLAPEYYDVFGEGEEDLDW